MYHLKCVPMALASRQSLSYPKVNVLLTYNIHFRALYTEWFGVLYFASFDHTMFVMFVFWIEALACLFLYLFIIPLQHIYNWVIHSLLNGHLDCFQFRVIKNNATFSILVYLWVHRCVPDKHPRAKLLWHKYKCS